MLLSSTGITQKMAFFFSPRLPKSISSTIVILAYCGILKVASRTAALTKMDFAVLPAACLKALNCFTATWLGCSSSNARKSISSGLRY